VIPFTLFAASILPFLDGGQRLDIEQTRQHLADRSIVDWLVSELGPSFARVFSDEAARDEVAEAFAHLNALAAPGWSAGVDRDGLCLLLAYAVEACRQANLEQRWSDY
jgi:hypothetical protein